MLTMQTIGNVDIIFKDDTFIVGIVNDGKFDKTSYTATQICYNPILLCATYDDYLIQGIVDSKMTKVKWFRYLAGAVKAFHQTGVITKDFPKGIKQQ